MKSENVNENAEIYAFLVAASFTGKKVKKFINIFTYSVMHVKN